MSALDWCGEVDRALDLLAVDESGDRPRVVLVGAYNSAKTSLLRRLLVETGQPVPAWARVSAREETAAVNEVTVLGCDLVDTPGLDALSRWHASDARGALLSADAVAVLTTSNLFAAGTELQDQTTALDVLSGEFFRDGGLQFPGESLAVLVTRFDEAALDPSDFPEEYEDLRQAKLGEVRRLLDKHAPGAAERALLEVVAADPFGRARNREVSAAEFAASKGWDRVSVVSAWLESLPSRLPELRQWSGVRRRAAALQQRCDELGPARAEIVARVADAKVAVSDAENVHSRCLRGRESAEARLSSALERALFSAPHPGEQRFREELRQLLETELRHWAELTSEDLRQLADACGAALPDLRTNETERVVKRLLDAAGRPSETQEKARAAKEVIDIVRKVVDDLAVPEGQPQVADPGGPRFFPKISEQQAAAFNVLLSAAASLLEVSESEFERRAEQRQHWEKRLQSEGRDAARLMFTSADSPGGWEGLFDLLEEASEVVLEQRRERLSVSEEKLSTVSNALDEVRGLLASVPQP